MQQFVAERAHRLPQHGLRVLTAAQFSQRRVQRLPLQVAALLAQRAHRRHGLQRAHPAHERLRLVVNQGLGLLRGLAAQMQVVVDDPAQIVNRVEIHILQFAGLRLNVPGHGDVDDEHRATLAFFQRRLNRALAEDRQRAGGATDDDVGLVEMAREIVQGGGESVVTPRQFLGTRRSAVGDNHFLQALVAQVPGREFDHLPGADQQGARGGQIAEDLLRQPRGGVGDGDRMAADAGVAANPLRHHKRVLEQAPEQFADAARARGAVVGLLQLPQDLRLAHEHGVQAAGHAQNVLDRLIARMAIDERLQGVARAAVKRGEPVQRPLAARRRQIAIDLGAVAGGENRRLADIALPRQLGQSPRQGLAGDRDPLPNRHRRARVVESQGQ